MTTADAPVNDLQGCRTAELFFKLDEAEASSSPHCLSNLSISSQQASTSKGVATAPRATSCLTDKQEGASAQFWSVGAFEYHGVSCRSHSSAKVAIKIFLATKFEGQHEMRASRTAVLSV
jgi:hypothetical protein